MSPKSKRALNIQYYRWQDIRIGAVVHVYGRPLVCAQLMCAARRPCSLCSLHPSCCSRYVQHAAHVACCLRLSCSC